MEKPAFNSPEDVSATEPRAIQAHTEFETLVGPGALIGTWVNVNPGTRGIVKVVLGWTGGHLAVHVFGACTPTPCDWGNVNGLAYGDTVSSTLGDAFSAVYTTGFKSTLVTGEVKRTFLQVDTFNHFTDGSGRSDYHFSELFRRA